LVRLIPRDEKFFDLFDQQSKLIARAATLLHELFMDPGRLDEWVAAIKAVEHEADDMTREVVNRLNRSFVTPLDREDILHLASRLDSIVDLMDGTARRAAQFRIAGTREEAVHLSGLLLEATEQVGRAVASMKKPRTMEKHTRRVKELEEEGDAVYHAAMGRLFSGNPDPLDVIKWKELFDTLEDSLDRCDDVSNLLKAISLKHS
jgi:predicted phosphate transport protein (TIGR00153 family)